MVRDWQCARALKEFVKVLDLFLEHGRQGRVLEPQVIKLVAEDVLILEHEVFGERAAPGG